jgi:hypothetical protein
MNEALKFLLDLGDNFDENFLNFAGCILLNFNEFNKRSVLKTNRLFGGETKESFLMFLREVFLINKYATRKFINL